MQNLLAILKWTYKLLLELQNNSLYPHKIIVKIAYFLIYCLLLFAKNNYVFLPWYVIVKLNL